MCVDVCTMFKDEDMMTGNITQTIKYTFVSKQTTWNFHRGSDDKASLSVSWDTNEITAYSVIVLSPQKPRQDTFHIRQMHPTTLLEQRKWFYKYLYFI